MVRLAFSETTRSLVTKYGPSARARVWLPVTVPFNCREIFFSFSQSPYPRKMASGMQYFRNIVPVYSNLLVRKNKDELESVDIVHLKTKETVFSLIFVLLDDVTKPSYPNYYIANFVK